MTTHTHQTAPTQFVEADGLGQETRCAGGNGRNQNQSGAAEDVTQQAALNFCSFVQQAKDQHQAGPENKINLCLAREIRTSERDLRKCV